MSRILPDLRFAARRLNRSKPTTILVLLILALAIASNTSVFSLVNALLLRPLPVAEPETLAVLYETDSSNEDMSISYLDFIDWQKYEKSFSSLALFVPTGYSYLADKVPFTIPALAVSGEFFRTLGVAAASGRTLTPEDDLPGAPLAVVVSQAFWRRHLGGDPAAIGRPLSLGGESFLVAGIMPKDFKTPFQSDADLWVAIQPTVKDGSLADRGTRPGGWVFGRLRPGIDFRAARGEMGALARRLASEYPGSNKDLGAVVLPVIDRLLGPLRPALGILIAAAGLVLLVACANIANLLLSRGVLRRREMAVRSAMGASRRQLVVQTLAETSLVATLGGGLGLLLGYWGLRALLPFMPADIPRIDEVRLDFRVFVFAAAVTALSTLLAGILPALQASRVSISQVLGETAANLGSGRPHRRISDVLVVTEIALALILVIGAGLLLGSIRRLTTMSPGFNPRGLLTARVELGSGRYPDPLEQSAFYQLLLERLGSVPGVDTAAAVFPLPLSGTRATAGFVVEGEAAIADRRESTTLFRMSPGAFRALGIALVGGRGFESRDRAGAGGVAVVDTTFAARLGGVSGALSRRVKLSHSPESSKPWLQVVGVAAHILPEGVAGESGVQLYIPLAQDPLPFASLVARSRRAPRPLELPLRKAVAEIDPEQALTDVLPLTDYVAGLSAPTRVLTVILVAFGLVTLVLAALGVYGVVSHAVSQRIPEIGLRMAIGATPRMIGRSIGSGAVLRIAAGLAVGALGAWAVTRFLASYLFEVQPRDPGTFLAAALGVLLTALLATLVPTARAARIAPAEALRALGPRRALTRERDGSRAQ